MPVQADAAVRPRLPLCSERVQIAKGDAMQRGVALCRAAMSAVLGFIECELQLQHVHARLAEHSELAAARVALDERLDVVRRHLARLRPTPDLLRRPDRADLAFD